MLVKLCVDFVFNFKDMLISFFDKCAINNNDDICKEYYLKLDGYYFCQKKLCLIAVIRVRNKRIVERIPVRTIVNDKTYLRELHSVDTCMLGILANNERNGIFDSDAMGWKKMKRSKNCNCLIKSNPILKIAGRYISYDGIEITQLYSAILNKQIDIPTIELISSQALLYSLDSIDAISIGYNASEQYIKKVSSGCQG